MRKILFLLWVLCFSVPAFAGPEHSHEPYVGSAPFEQLKKLEGKWTGVWKEAGKTEPAEPTEVTYEVSSGGSALVEKLSPGTPHEMVSVYNDEKGELVMTHYCLLKNQPKLKLKSADENQIELEFTEANGVKAEDPHMHALRITFEGPDSIKQEWYGYENGKWSEVPTTIQLKRTTA
jgi:hypothetical protein